MRFPIAYRLYGIWHKVIITLITNDRYDPSNTIFIHTHTQTYIQGKIITPTSSLIRLHEPGS